MFCQLCPEWVFLPPPVLDNYVSGAVNWDLALDFSCHCNIIIFTKTKGMAAMGIITKPKGVKLFKIIDKQNVSPLDLESGSPFSVLRYATVK